MEIEAREEFRSRRWRRDDRLLRRGNAARASSRHTIDEDGGGLDAGGRALEDARRDWTGARRPAGLREQLGL